MGEIQIGTRSHGRNKNRNSLSLEKCASGEVKLCLSGKARPRSPGPEHMGGGPAPLLSLNTCPPRHPRTRASVY
eukprot:scaffold12427_cov79-Isochrysis_galbana.AAC.2